MNLVVSGAVLPHREGRWAISVKNGYIERLVSEATLSLSELNEIKAASTEFIEVDGQMVIPGLIDSHFHLDKTQLLERCSPVTGDFQEALEKTLQAKESFTVEDIQSRACRHIEQVMSWGITAMRSHVEVDPTIGLVGMKALIPLRERYRWGLTLQLAVFAQEGITQDPETTKLLHQAIQLGGDVIGSAPYVDPNPKENIRIIFDIAEEFNCDVDFHLDFLDDDEPLLVPFVVEETLRRGWQGRVSLGHMTKLASLKPEQLEAIATDLADGGISVIILPASDLYMMARRDTHNVRRGVAPAHRLAQNGVNVGLATNNVLNLFTPFGDGDVLKICTLVAQILHLGTEAQHQLCLDMATSNAARAIGLRDYGLEPGCRADFVILNAHTISEIVGAHPTERTVIKNGEVVAQSRLIRQLFI